MTPLRWIAVVMVVAVAGWVVDRLALAAEARGWLYWRHRRPSTSSTAFQSLGSFLEPTRQVVVEERQRQEADIDVAADDDPVPPTGTGQR